MSHSFVKKIFKVSLVFTLWSVAATASELSDYQNDCFSKFTQTFNRYPSDLPYSCFNISNSSAYDATIALIHFAANGGKMSTDVFKMMTKIETESQANCVETFLPRYSRFDAIALQQACSLPFKP